MYEDQTPDSELECMVWPCAVWSRKGWNGLHLVRIDEDDLANLHAGGILQTFRKFHYFWESSRKAAFATI